MSDGDASWTGGDGHVRLAETLRQSEERFRLMVESISDYAIFLLDPNGRIATWNRGAERIKGYTEDEVVGRHFSIFYPQSDIVRRFPQHELEVAAREGTFEDEGWRLRKDGTRFWANVVITALRDEEGRLVGFGKVTRDLTERRRAEGTREALEREREARRLAEDLTRQVRNQAARLQEQAATLEMLNVRLQRVNDELVARSRDAEQARAEAEAANHAKSDFLANMSHELRTPINAIVGYGELLEMEIAGPVTDEQRLQLERIRVSSRHLLMLIDDILDIAKIEAGRLEIARGTARVRDAVAAALALVGPQAEAEQLEIADRCGEDGDRAFRGDEDRIRQILVNLLSNAVKFTPSGGTIVIRCTWSPLGPDGPDLRGDGPWLGLHVEDTGIGIPAEQLESVFAPFVQVETGHTRTYGGTGLGLSISRQLARLMGGDLTADSAPGRGSRFTLWLPAVPAAEP